jgi:alpha-glucosidase
MLCDTPTNYYREQECTEFISGMPTTWDETLVLEAALADHLVLARRKGESWFVGAMCDAGGPKAFEIDLSFLGEGAYEAVMMEDGINASKIATDYTRKKSQIQAGEKLNIRLAGGGGWAAKFSPSR